MKPALTVWAHLYADDDRIRPKPPEESVRELIASGESRTLEFKSTARWNVKESRADKAMEQIIIKTAAAFLNSTGGDLLIGVQDDGSIFGIETDQQLFSADKRNRDTYENWLMTKLLAAYGNQHAANLGVSFARLAGKDVCRVTVSPASNAVYIKENSQDTLYVRTGNSTRSLSTREAVAYHQQRFTKSDPPPVVAERLKSSDPKKYADFRKVLETVEVHPKRRYFVFKSIILNNLFGVDIMEEAVEICKLRLFLKLAAQVEPDNTKDNLGIEPLPDIDFNIRTGNTLVGYATYDEVLKSVEGDWIRQEAIEKIKVKAAGLQQKFDKFRQLQTDGDDSVPAAHKQELQKRLKALEDELNRHLAGEYGVKVSDKVAYSKWMKSHQPFHWFIQFFGILNSGGFDVIIGNPPYVEYKTVVNQYKVRNYNTDDCGNLYAFVVEKSFALAMPTGRIGLIVPISLTAAQRMAKLQELLVSQSDLLLLANYGLRPAALFPGVMQRLTIFISAKGNRHLVYSSDYITWYAEEREALFPLLKHFPVGALRQTYSVPKTNSQIGHSTLSRILSNPRPWQHYNQFKGAHSVFYHNAGGYWIKTFNFKPFYKSLVDADKSHTTISELRLPTAELANTYLGILNSSLFYFFWKTLTDARHVYPSDIVMFPIALPMGKTDLKEITRLGHELMSAFKKNRKRIVYGNAEVDQFSVGPTKTILDEIDTVLARHYGFTPEELDFILNYDIKYRRGRVTESEED